MSDSDRSGRRCVVAGQVQGVFFRASTRDKARELGVDGEARNLPDGTVEVVMTGSPRQLDALCDWLREGPSQASVTGVECEDIAPSGHRGFSTD